MTEKTIEFRVTITVDDQGEVDSYTMRAAILDGIARAEDEGALTTLDDQTTLIKAYNVTHVSTKEG